MSVRVGQKAGSHRAVLPAGTARSRPPARRASRRLVTHRRPMTTLARAGCRRKPRRLLACGRPLVASAVAAGRAGAVRRRRPRAGRRAAQDAAAQAGRGAASVAAAAPRPGGALHGPQLPDPHRLRPARVPLHPPARSRRWQIAMASFVGYAIANNVGFALLSGTSARYRFYSRWGLSGQDISRVVLFYSGTFWLGPASCSAAGRCASGPAQGLDDVRRRPALARVDRLAVLLTTALAYPLVALFSRQRRCTIGGMRIALPSIGLVGSQFVLSALDWGLAAAVLYVLLPDPRPDFRLLPRRVPGRAARRARQPRAWRPRRVRVADGPAAAAAGRQVVLPALALFRVDLLPGAARRRAAGAHRRRVLPAASPRGAVGQRLRHADDVGGAEAAGGVHDARPAPCCCSRARRRRTAGRLAWLSTRSCRCRSSRSRISSAASSASGCWSSRGAWRAGSTPRTASAVGGLGVGIVASLLKGADYEEALVLAALLVALVAEPRGVRPQGGALRHAVLAGVDRPARRRRGARRSASGCSRSGTSTTRHELWWRFEVDRTRRASCAPPSASSSRSLLVGRATADCGRPPAGELPGRRASSRRRAAWSRRSRGRRPNLVFLRDKALLWNEPRTRVPDVRRPGPHLGGARRSRRPGSAAEALVKRVPRALRRLPGHAGRSTRRRRSGCTSTPTSA